MGRDDHHPAARAGAHGRIDDIEVLRAIAIGLVLTHHAQGDLIPWVSGADGPFGFWSGVDLFFAISGFVIGRSLLPTLPPPREHRAFLNTALSFWVRRAWRLLPSAWLWLIVAILASVFFNRSGVFGPLEANLRGAAAAALNLANFNFVYTFARRPSGAVFHYWSLSLEEQFYLVLPFVMFLARSRLPMVLVAIAASQFLIKRTGETSDLLMLEVRSDALCLGVLLAIWSRQADWRRREPVFLGSPLCRWLLLPAFLLVFALITGPAFSPYRFTVGLLAVFAAAIVWVASYDRDYLFPPGALKRALCWVGTRSYGVYLIHVPVYFAARELWFRLRPEVLQPGPQHAALLLATSLPLVAILAELNFRLVEDPLRRYGARIADRIRRSDVAEVRCAAQKAG